THILRDCLGKRFAGSRRQNDWHVANSVTEYRFHRLKYRRRGHHHAGAATIRRIVDCAVIAYPELADVVDMDLDLSGSHCASNDRLIERAAEYPGENREDVKPHECFS